MVMILKREEKLRKSHQYQVSGVKTRGKGDQKKTLLYFLFSKEVHDSQRAKTDLNKKSGTKQKTIKTLLYKPQGFK